MKLEKRIKRIVTHTVEDYHISLRSIDEETKDTIKWVCEALLEDEEIEDLHTYEISLKALKLLNSLDLVDLEFIHSLLLTDAEPSEAKVTVSFVFDKVVI